MNCFLFGNIGFIILVADSYFLGECELYGFGGLLRHTSELAARRRVAAGRRGRITTRTAIVCKEATVRASLIERLFG